MKILINQMKIKIFKRQRCLFSNIIKSKFAKEEENESMLLNQMNCHHENNDINNFPFQKENFIFLGNDISISSTLKQGEFLLINKKYYAQVFSIESKKSILILVNYFNINTEKINKIEKTNSINFKLAELNYQLTSLNLSSNMVKSINKRKIINSILFTGNILIDYINPQFIGNFILMKGMSNLGQENLISSIIERYENSIIILTLNQKLKSKLNKLEKKDISVFLLSQDSYLSDLFYYPKVILNYIKRKKENGENILFIFDNASEFFIAEKAMYSNINRYCVSTLFSNLFEETGVFDRGCLTVLIVSKYIIIYKIKEF